MTDDSPAPPILSNKDYQAPSTFIPENLLREARRQNNIPNGQVPEYCVLDPDGDIVRYLIKEKKAVLSKTWACYHSDLHITELNGREIGIVGCAVGASYAVLIAEQLFASGCQLLISITSSGVINQVADPPYYVLIDRALRDEGTSYHYLAPTQYVDIAPEMLARFADLKKNFQPPLYQGTCWTTDAPFRETQSAIEAAAAEGILAVEMESAALYAFSLAKNKPVICFAQVTNQMAVVDGDFEKGAFGGSLAALELIGTLVKTWES